MGAGEYGVVVEAGVNGDDAAWLVLALGADGCGDAGK